MYIIRNHKFVIDDEITKNKLKILLKVAELIYAI